VRLLFDENLSFLSAQWAATTLAVDVLDARAAGLAGKTDREVRRFAIETDRILVTLDADFGNLIRFSPSGRGRVSAVAAEHPNFRFPHRLAQGQPIERSPLVSRNAEETRAY